MLKKMLVIALLFAMCFLSSDEGKDMPKELNDAVTAESLHKILKLIDFRDINPKYVYTGNHFKGVQQMALQKAVKYWEDSEHFQLDPNSALSLSGMKNVVTSSPYIKMKLIEWYLSLDCTSLECFLFRYNVSFLDCHIFYLPKNLSEADTELLKKMVEVKKNDKLKNEAYCFILPKPLKNEYMKNMAYKYSVLSSTLPLSGENDLIRFLKNRYLVQNESDNENASNQDKTQKGDYLFQIYSGHHQKVGTPPVPIPEEWFR